MQKAKRRVKATLSWSERERKACAKYCRVSLDRVIRVETPTDSGGHFTGIRVFLAGGDIRWIDVGRNVRKFVEARA